VTQERAVLTREQLLNAAAAEIHRVGFRDATISTITEAAGISPGAVYFHFRSKEDIARALIERQHRAIRAAAEEILQRANQPALVAMMLVCHELARRLVDDPLIRAGIRLTIDRSTYEAPVKEPYRDWLNTFTDLASQAERAGETTGAVPPAMLAHFIVPAFAGVQLVSETFTGRADLVSRIHEMWRVLILAIVPPARQSSVFDAAARIFIDNTSRLYET
jgi:AcrR family transcriptional regulator